MKRIFVLTSSRLPSAQKASRVRLAIVNRHMLFERQPRLFGPDAGFIRSAVEPKVFLPW